MINTQSLVALVSLVVFVAGCTTPKSVVLKRYDDERDRNVSTLFENEHTALVIARAEDENCTYVDQYVVLNVPPSNEWVIRDSEHLQDCDKKMEAKMAAEYKKWRADRLHNEQVWHPGAQR